MTDKEVGELWGEAVRIQDSKSYIYEWVKDVLALIRKLVEERARRWPRVEEITLDEPQINRALRDFGIDPATWDATNLPQNRED